jgi:inorganic pyrophosphatase
MADFKLQGRISFSGIDIAVENRAGSIRRGESETGEEWETRMFYPYGYIRGVYGTDGDFLDCFVRKPKKGEEPPDKVYIIHQVNPKTGNYDEDKVMLGWDSWENARNAYLTHYDTADFLGDHTVMTIEEFKQKLEERKKTKVKKIFKSLRTGRLF